MELAQPKPVGLALEGEEVVEDEPVEGVAGEEENETRSVLLLIDQVCWTCQEYGFRQDRV